LYKNLVKRVIDFIGSVIGLVLLSPILLIVMVLLAIATHGKPLFFQTRPGLNEKLFRIIKFKTMTDEVDESGELLPDSSRLTKIGNFVRKTSLDEVPQLWNVLKGDMSLIGPRPLLPEYLPFFNQEQKKRHDVRPGITGWAQVNGRNNVSWEEKFKLDVYYVDNLNFILDVRIILLTIKKVLFRENITSENSVSMEKFKGN